MSNYDPTLFVNREKKFRGFQKLIQPATEQAVMLIEAAPDMGKSWLVERMEHYCQKELTAVPVAQVDFRNPREVNRIHDTLGLIRLLRDKLGNPAYFNTLNTTINTFTEAQVGQNVGLALLRRNLEIYFDLEELKTLCFDLGINFDNLSGGTLAGKSRELINYCQRHSLLNDLVQLCLEHRPQVNWQENFDAPTVTAVAPTSADTGVQDHDAPIWGDSEMERQRAQRQINEAFFECLAALAKSSDQVVFLIDSYEAAPNTAELWISKELLPRLRDQQITKTTIIITGRKTPDLSDLNMSPLLVQTNLEPLTEQDVREYFENRRKLTGLDFRTIMLTSGGIPGALAMMADHALLTAVEDDDFFKDL